MPQTRPRSKIRTRLAVVMSLLIALICLVIFLYFPDRLRNQALNSILNEAYNVTHMAAYSVAPGLAIGDRSEVSEALYSLRENNQLAFVVVLDHSGNEFASFNRRLAERYGFRSLPMSGRPQQVPKGKRDDILGGFSEGEQIYQTYSPILYRGRKAGEVYVGFDLSRMHAQIRNSRQTIALVSLIIFTLGVGAAVALSTAITGPLSRIVDTVERIAGGDLAKRADVIRQDEVGQLASTFNIMVDRLQTTQLELENLNETLERRVDERTQQLQISEERYRTLFERNLAGVYIRALDGSIIGCNDAFARMFGYPSRKALLAEHASVDYVDPEDHRRLLDWLQEKGPVTNFEVQLKSSTGNVLWVLENVSLSPQNMLEGIVLDITDRKRAEQEIEYRAYHDGLTGLSNRTLFRDRLSTALAHARRVERSLAVMFLDLDDLKVINDSLGHVEGDRLLQSVGERLTQSLRSEDTVARVGGDEFTILVPDIGSEDDASTVAKKVIDAIRSPFMVAEDEIHITASMGVAVYPADGEDPDTLLTNADRAMYRVKTAGGNDYQFFGRAGAIRGLGRLTLEQHLRQAVERDEFVVYYQPQLNLLSREISGMEALVRWNHPEGMIVEPSSFIALAEHTGLIIPMGESVLLQACRQARRWHSAGFPKLRVSVNVSPRQFHQRNFVGMVRSVLDQTGIDPPCLELEITESLAMQTTSWSLSRLRELKELGLSIAMDDFGTGQSSLSYLHRLPIDTVKIDRSFMHDAETGTNEPIVAAVLMLCNHLKLRTVAEGVETEEQCEYLRRHGCVEIQGYYYSAPVPAEQFDRMLTGAAAAGAGH